MKDITQTSELPSMKGTMLRDHLATDRSILANERTFLAYLRTSLTFTITGISFIKFFESYFTSLLGWIFIPLGLLTTFLGIKSYQRMDRLIREENEKNNK